MRKTVDSLKRINVILAALLVIFSLNIFVYAVDENSRSAAVKQLEEKLQSAKEDYEKAETEYQTVVSEKEEMERNINHLKETITELENNNFDEEIDSNYLKWQEALNSIGDKENVYNNIRQEIEKSLVEYNKGTFGFFEYVGAEDALEVLNNSKYASYTHKGELNDATNLDNMRNSFDFIRQCNDLRLKEGNDPQNGELLKTLKITDYMMATAQADANYSAVNIEHAEQFGIGENLSWGYSDPFSGWYDMEKQQYLSGSTDGVGHYLNIVDSDYGITGFAIVKGGAYGIEHGQTFLWDSDDSNAMTVDEYERRFMEYYNKVTAEAEKLIPEYYQAESDLTTAKLNSSEFEEEYNKSVSEKQKVTEELSSQKQELLSVEKKLSEIQQDIMDKKAFKDEKEKLYLSLQEEYEKLKSNQISQNEKSDIVVDTSSKSSSEKEISNTSSVISKAESTVSSETSDISTESHISEMSVFESSTVNQENSPTNTAVIFIIVGAVIFIAVVAVIIIKNNRRQSK